MSRKANPNIYIVGVHFIHPNLQLLRSKNKVKPLFVSPGHRITLDQAVHYVLACATRYRLPEPTRLADKLSKANGKL